jgi:hypothetical protein
VLGWAPADDGLDGFAAVEQASRPLRQPAPAPELEEHCAGFEYLPSASYAPRPAPRGPPAQAPKIQPNPRSSSRPPRLGGGGARPRSIDRRQTLKPVRSRSQTQRTLAPPLASGSPRHVGSGRGRGSRPIRSLDLVRLHAITALVLDALPARDVAIATRLAEARHRQTAQPTSWLDLSAEARAEAAMEAHPGCARPGLSGSCGNTRRRGDDRPLAGVLGALGRCASLLDEPERDPRRSAVAQSAAARGRGALSLALCSAHANARERLVVDHDEAGVGVGSALHPEGE